MDIVKPRRRGKRKDKFFLGPLCLYAVEINVYLFIRIPSKLTDERNQSKTGTGPAFLERW